MKYLAILLSGLFALGAAGCNSTEGLGHYVEAAAQPIED